jgi:hypothetical protein
VLLCQKAVGINMPMLFPLVNNQTASVHQEMDASYSGNPRLAYGFRATPDPAIDLNVHHKRPPLRRHFPSLSSSFSLYSHPPIRKPFCPALVFANRPHSIILHEAFFSNLAGVP